MFFAIEMPKGFWKIKGKKVFYLNCVLPKTLKSEQWLTPPAGVNQQWANKQRETMLIYVSANTTYPFGAPVPEPPAAPACALSQEKATEDGSPQDTARTFR